jgi:hypothetical protein
MFFREHRRLLAYSQHLINAKAISGVGQPVEYPAKSVMISS